LTITSEEIHCHCLDAMTHQFHNGILYCPAGVRTWSSTKIHSQYKCFKWSLKSLSIRMSSYEVIPRSMKTMPVFIARIKNLASSVKWPWSASSIPHFVNNTHLLLQKTCNEPLISSFIHPSLLLTHDD
jgi:hypothetical protein